MTNMPQIVALLNGALIALAANLVNLLDLRPGRALKAFAAGALLLAPGAGWSGMAPLLAVALPAAAYAPADLRARAMMGDTGANALGAALGATAALQLGLTGKLAALALLAALQVASEFVSFSAVIERCAPLRFVDRLGRG
jgi:UDP-N-acetylmuramyl pentapeptide phosphotransferase/UDP-N-acetylglucosamine-1-phosphate transferase